MAVPFSEIQEDFLRITAATVLCSVTTVDARGRPRARMLHPVLTVAGGRPLGWALTGRMPLKTRHLAANAHVACAYWTPPTTRSSPTASRGWRTTPRRSASGRCS
jgi:hypothetical protein